MKQSNEGNSGESGINNPHSDRNSLILFLLLGLVALIPDALSQGLVDAIPSLQLITQLHAVKAEANAMGEHAWLLIYHWVVLLIIPYLAFLTCQGTRYRVVLGKASAARSNDIARILVGAVLAGGSIGYLMYGGGQVSGVNWHNHGRFVYGVFSHLGTGSGIAIGVGILGAGVMRIFSERK